MGGERGEREGRGERGEREGRGGVNISRAIYIHSTVTAAEGPDPVSVECVPPLSGHGCHVVPDEVLPTGSGAGSIGRHHRELMHHL